MAFLQRNNQSKLKRVSCMLKRRYLQVPRVFPSTHSGASLLKKQGCGTGVDSRPALIFGIERFLPAPVQFVQGKHRFVRCIFFMDSNEFPQVTDLHACYGFRSLYRKYWGRSNSTSSQNGSRKEKFVTFRKMIMDGYAELKPAAMIDLLRSSVDLGVLDFGRAVHCLVITSNMSEDLSVSTNVLSMYSKLGSLENARLVFDKMLQRDCVVWNVMISAYSQLRKPRECIELLRDMAESGIRADMFTAIPSISALRQLKYARHGKQMHAHVMRNGSDDQVSVHNALIDMYCQCDCLSYARKIFDAVKEKTAISWSSIIKGYITHNNNLEALSLFAKMKSSDVAVDFVAVINVLPACVNIGALEQVKHLHGLSVKLGLNLLSSVNSALLISYAKCGCIDMATKLFGEEEINSKDVITWNAMISAYAKHGDWHQCFQMYDHMKQLALKPDQVTFLAVLTACVNSGLVKEGREFFKEMKETYGCKPNQEHYACMVDLLGRAGHLIEARELVSHMPFEPDARTWGPLLSACKKHVETNNAEFAAEKLVKMDSKNAGNYVLLSSIYAAAGKWDKFAETRRLLKEKGLKKTPGCSWLEIDGQMHQFVVADHSHPKVEAIFQLLGIVDFEIKGVRGKLK